MGVTAMNKKNKNPFGSYKPIMPVIDDKKNENRCKLTQTQKTKIKNIVGICEMIGCKNDPHQVHHIKFCRGEGGTDSYNNLIVLCGSCHDNAHGKGLKGEITPKSKLYGIVKRRAKNKADLIKGILKKPNRKSDDKDPWSPFGLKF